MSDQHLMVDNKHPSMLAGDPDSPSSVKPTVKRKRKSPAVPWKKPKDMPKRPLSAYNLFFKDERERILGQGRSSQAGTNPEKEGGTRSHTEKKKRPTAGIGFANLAKTIAAKWNELDPESRAPYEGIAAKEKARYDKAVAKWRAEQKEKAAKAKALKNEAENNSPSKSDSTLFPPVTSDRSMDSFAIKDTDYPPQWFQSGTEQQDGEAGIPSFIDTVRNDSSRSSASQDSPRRGSRPPPVGMLTGSLDSRAATADHSSSYFAHSPAYYARHHPYGRSHSLAPAFPRRRMDPYTTTASLYMANTMRDSRRRNASMPPGRSPQLASDMDRIQAEVAELRRARNSIYQDSDITLTSQSGPHTPSPRPSRSAPPVPITPHLPIQPRSASLPPNFSGALGRSNLPVLPQGQLPGDASYDERGPRSRRNQEDGTTPHDEAVFEASLRSLSENLDDDAISFLTSIRFE